MTRLFTAHNSFTTPLVIPGLTTPCTAGNTDATRLVILSLSKERPSAAEGIAR